MEEVFMRMTLLALLLVVPGLALAKPSEMKKYREVFPDKAADVTCKTCHSKGKELNDYGKAYLASGKDFAKMEKAK